MTMAKQSQLGAYEPAIPVLLTRPLAQSEHFGATLSARFPGLVRPVITPLMRPVFHNPTIPTKSCAAVIFTSQAAVDAARRMQALGVVFPKDAYCVGARTADAAKAEGFRTQSAAGDAEALLQELISQNPRGPLLYLHGRDTRGNVAERLNSAGIETISALVYQQDPLPLSDEARILIQQEGTVVVPLFSPRSAVLLERALPDAVKARFAVAAISGAVMDAAQALRPCCTEVAVHPDADAMLEAVNRLLIRLRSS